MRTLVLVPVIALLLLALAWWGTDVQRVPTRFHPDEPELATPRATQVVTELAPIELPARVEALDPEVVIDPANYPPEEIAPVAATPVRIASSDSEGIPVHGRLLLPEAWGSATHQVRFSGADGEEYVTDAAHERDAGGYFVLPFALCVGAPGRYVVSTEDPPFTTELDVAGPVEGFEVRLPQPARLRIHLVDRVSGSAIENARVFCYPAVRPARGARSYAVETIEDRAGGFDARCAPGDVELSCTARTAGYEPQRLTIHVQEGENEVVVRMLTATRLAVQLVDAVTLLPLQCAERTSISYVIESADGLSGGGGVLNLGVDGKVELRLKSAARQILRISGPPEGYRPSYPQAVQPALGAVTDVVFGLVRVP